MYNIVIGFANGKIILHKLSFQDLKIFDSSNPILIHEGVVTSILIIDKLGIILSIGNDKRLVI